MSDELENLEYQCDHCDGSGVARNYERELDMCSHCGGTGWIPETIHPLFDPTPLTEAEQQHATIVAMQARIDELESENKQLRYELSGEMALRRTNEIRMGNYLIEGDGIRNLLRDVNNGITYSTAGFYQVVLNQRIVSAIRDAIKQGGAE